MLISISLFSCRMEYIVVDLEKPPEWVMPDTIIRLGLNNRILDSIMPGKEIGTDRLFLSDELESMQHEASELCLKAMQTDIEHGDNFEFASLISSGGVNEYDSILPEPVHYMTLRDMCSFNKADALVSIELLGADAAIEYSTYNQRYNTGSTENIVYDTRRKKMSVAKLNMEAMSFWRIYDCSAGEIMCEREIISDVSVEADADSREKAKNKLPSYGQILNNLTVSMGQEVLKKLSPSFVTVERYYYGAGSVRMRKAKKLVMFRRWEDAAIIWETELEHGLGRTAGMAAYNLALVAEIAGEKEKALSMINRAFEMYPCREVRNYRLVLESYVL